MIFYLKGTISEVYDDKVILDVAHVGYEIFCKDSHKYFVNGEKEEKFFIFEHIQENAHTLYGFAKREELDMLKVLISVKGIGPKVGLRILNAVDISLLVNAIEQEDEKMLPAVKSVGPKARKRLINELKGKIPAHLIKMAAESKVEPSEQLVINEALEALIALGMTEYEANGVLENAPKEMKDTADLVKWALKNKS